MERGAGHRGGETRGLFMEQEDWFWSEARLASERGQGKTANCQNPMAAYGPYMIRESQEQKDPVSKRFPFEQRASGPSSGTAPPTCRGGRWVEGLTKSVLVPLIAGALGLTGCEMRPTVEPSVVTEPDYSVERERMVAYQIEAPGRDIRDPRVLDAMRRVPRHEFVPADYRNQAYEDHPLPIGYGQSISQPYIVAFMTEQLRPRPTDRVLELGTGSGYQADVLSLLVAEVYTIEILEPLAQRAEQDLGRLGYHNVKVRCGDGYLGWPEAAPFDAIIVTCAPEQVPQALIDQLKDGGRMIVPVGSYGDQNLWLLVKEGALLKRSEVLPVRFVPMVRGEPSGAKSRP